MPIDLIFEKKYVAFLDVLGFKQLVFGGENGVLQTYFDAINSTLEVIRNDKKRIDSLIVSDSTILISPDTKEDFRTLVRAVQTIQYYLSNHNIWIRGGISFGQVYFNKEKNLIVGKGLVKSYLLEQKAKFPRVVIDPSIILRIGETREEFMTYLNDKIITNGIRRNLVQSLYSRTNDDSIFVSFGHRLISEAIKKKNFELLFNNIRKNLYSHADTYEKYYWIKNHIIDVGNEMEIWNEEGDFTEDAFNYLKIWIEKFRTL